MRVGKAKTVIWIIIILAIVVVYKQYDDLLLQWTMCTRWHLYHDNNIKIGTMELTLPFNWWVTESDDNDISIHRVSSLQPFFFGHISISVKELSRDGLNRFGPERNVQGIRAVRIGNLETLMVDDEAGYSVKYRVTSSGEENGTIIWTLSVPSQSIVINVMFLHPGGDAIVSSELISRIRFIPRE